MSDPEKAAYYQAHKDDPEEWGEAVDADIGTVRWFGPKWDAPITDNPRAEISVPLGEHCIECLIPFDHGDQGLGVAAHRSIAANGQVFYHLACFLRTIGATPW